jgi:RNA polymerase sigma-70 factor (ECF subfamily)
VEDIVQAAMIRLLEVDRRTGENRAFASISLRTAAYYAAMDEIRRHVLRKEVSGEDGVHVESAASPSADPEKGAAAREIEEGISDCLSRLARPRRLAVTLHLLGYSFPEAGRSLGWSAKKAEHLIYRGLDDLRVCLAAKGLGP